MINNSDKFSQLQNTYQEFHYLGFDYQLIDNELRVEFNFKVDDFVSFCPKLIFVNSQYFHFGNIPKQALESMIFNIGMVEMISYWKALVPKNIIIHPYFLNETQEEFWRKLFFNGLGEFFFLNSISPDYQNFISFHYASTNSLIAQNLPLQDHAIIPVGGGKDSVVSLELMKHVSSNNLALIMNPRGASVATAIMGGFKGRILEIQRSIDPELLRLNQLGFLNGHTPFSALLAFVTVLAAAASGRKYIALSNEGSANEPTVAGTKINHQYSKSIEFETDFRDYIMQNVLCNVQYFSLLRPLSEIQIAAIFSQSPKYFPVFKSCNVGSKSDSWCGKCPKCLFTFIILSPFVSPEILVNIFGANLLDNNDLENYFMELIGVAATKPFECIGTVDEVNLALCFAKRYYPKLPFLLQKHEQFFDFKSCNKAIAAFKLDRISDDHFLSDSFKFLIVNALKNDF